jgi:hypothetical protein
VTLMRIGFVGALLFGIGCVMQDAGEPGAGESDQRVGLEQPMSYTGDELIPAIGADSEAAAEEEEEEEAAEEADFDGIGDQEAFEDEASEEEAVLMGGGGKKDMYVCEYCASGKCYSGKNPKESRAKTQARKKCEARYKYGKCKFNGCYRK